jgi:hypothetical protein
MMDTLSAIQKHLEEEQQDEEQSTGVLLNAALREDDRAFFERLYDVWQNITTPDEWRNMMENASFEVVRFLWGFLHQNADVIAPEIGRDKHEAMLAVTTTRYWHLVFSRMAQSGTSFRDISGPQHAESMERGRKAHGILPSKIDDRPLGRLLGKDGQTVARWRKVTKKVGVPPLMRDDGSFTLETQVDWDAWMDYWSRIAEPQFWNRLQQRLQREAE